MCTAVARDGNLQDTVTLRTPLQNGTDDSPSCERCQEGNETATHILCECETLAYLRLRHLGQSFMEPSDYFDAPPYKILCFIRRAGLLRE